MQLHKLLFVFDVLGVALIDLFGAKVAMMMITRIKPSDF
jgi:hypothetical protein